MSKSIKLKNEHYLDSKSIAHNKTLLSNILKNAINSQVEQQSYNPSQVSTMTSDAISASCGGIDTSHSYIFNTTWANSATYDVDLCGNLGIFIKLNKLISTSGVAIMFHYTGTILINIWIDGNRWSGWKKIA